MAKQYKFILVLDNEREIDSEEEIHGHVAWPNYSQAEPVAYKGVFDSYEEAQKYASEYSLYKYVIDCPAGYGVFKEGYYYDSYEHEGDYFVSIYNAEDAVCADLNIEPGDDLYPHPDRYTIEETEVDGEPAYKYCFYFKDECVFDSYYDGDCYETYEEAEDVASSYIEEFEIEDEGVCPYTLEEIEIVDIRIVEIDD